ncbi:hypothetical protein KCU79_g149, partial [Aureobasidium melanogenum]
MLEKARRYLLLRRSLRSRRICCSSLWLRVVRSRHRGKRWVLGRRGLRVQRWGWDLRRQVTPSLEAKSNCRSMLVILLGVFQESL